MNEFDKGLYKIRNRMERLGADGYYLMHNHPAGTAVASLHDILSSKALSMSVKGFKGHVIVNSGTYATIDKNFKVSNNQKIENYSPDKIDKMMRSGKLYDKPVGRYGVVNLAYDLKNNPNYTMAVLVDSQNKVRIALDIPNTFYKMSDEQLNGYLRNVAVKNGAVKALFATQDLDTFERLKNLDTAQDVVLFVVESDGELKVHMAKDLKVNEMGEVENIALFKENYNKPALRGTESGAEYDTTLKDLRKETDKLIEGEEPETKVLSHYKTGIESDFIDTKAQEKMKKIIKSPDGRYEVIHNAEKIAESEDKIANRGIDSVFDEYCEKFDEGKEMTLDDVFDGEVLMQQYSYEGNTQKVLEVMARQAVLGKILGQRVQAMSIISRGTKAGKLMYMQKALEKYNNENGTNIKMNNKLIDELMKPETKTNKQIEKAIDAIYKDVGQKMPSTMWESLDEWRYFSMLFNPSTHIRNLGGNTGMHYMQALKNEINGAIQDIAKKINPKFQQTVSFRNRPTQEMREFAVEDLQHIGDIDKYGSKYKETFENEAEKYKKKLPRKTR